VFVVICAEAWATTCPRHQTAKTTPRNKIAPPGSLAGMGFWTADDFKNSIDDLFDALKDDDHVTRIQSRKPERQT